MISTYINGELRPNVRIAAGGKMEQTQAHVSSSSLTAQVPISEDLREYDYLRLADGSETLFAGTILGIDQHNLGTADPDFRVYDLSVASNADYLANIYVDMVFPAGATIMHILRGNEPESGDPWADPNVGWCRGLIDVRIVPEGITMGTVDDFSGARLEETAYLWGQKVTDVLDQLADVAGAWWEITPDRVFHMRYRTARSAAPEVIAPGVESTVHNLSVQRDAYTMYSAVRVVGGEGTSKARSYRLSYTGNPGYANSPWTRTSDDVLTCRYKIATITDPISYSIYDASAGGLKGYSVKVGHKGIHDDDDTYGALTSYGGHEIEIKPDRGLIWPTLTHADEYIRIDGISYLTPVYARYIDQALANEIKARRGGTGIIEAVIADDALTSNDDAMLTASTFLDRNARRAQTIKFDSLATGWAPGQVLRADDTYYGLSGEYQVTAVSASVIRDADGGSHWLTNVEASTVAYRDKYSALFYTPPKITFKLGGDAPASDGVLVKNDIDIQTAVQVDRTRWISWGDVNDRTGETWTGWADAFPTWEPFRDWTERIVDVMANYLTPYARGRLMALLQGKGETSDTTGLNLCAPLYVNDRTSLLWGVDMEGDPVITDNSISANYVMLEDEQPYLIEELSIMTNRQKLVSVPVSIDKRPGSGYAEFMLTVGMQHALK